MVPAGLLGEYGGKPYLWPLDGLEHPSRQKNSVKLQGRPGIRTSRL